MLGVGGIGREGGGIGGFEEGGADGGEGVGGVELAGLQEAVGVAERFELGGGEAAALEADLVEAVGVVVALDAGERVGQDVLGDGGASADVGCSLPMRQNWWTGQRAPTTA